MGRDWNKYNEELVKRGELLIDPMNFGLKVGWREDVCEGIYEVRACWGQGRSKVVFGQSRIKL